MKWIRRLPRWIPPLVVFLMAYFAVDAVGNISLAIFERWCASVDRAIFQTYDLAFREKLHEAILQAHRAVLVFGAVVYGFYRSSHNHPAGSSSYRKWLQSTPWHPGMPLPLGPATAKWWDALVVAGAVGLNNWTGDLQWMLVVLPFCAAYSVGCLFTLLTVRAKWETYVLGIGGALMLWALPNVPVMLALVGAMAIVGHEGLRQSLKSFPWEKAGKNEQKDPWPLTIYDDFEPRITHRQAGLTVVMLTSWLGALFYQSMATMSNVILWTALICLLGCVCRWATYCASYRPPLTLLGRIMRGRLILPGYDHALIVPWMGVVLTVGVPIELVRWGLPAPAIGMISVGIVLFVLMTGGPVLRVWQLTGYHCTSSSAARKTTVVKA